MTNVYVKRVAGVGLRSNDPVDNFPSDAMHHADLWKKNKTTLAWSGLAEEIKVIPDDFRGAEGLEETEAGVVPLMVQLKKNAADSEIVRQLDHFVSLAFEKEYAEAGKYFAEMKYKEDPFVDKIMTSMRTLVRIAEVMRPNPDPEKRFPT